MEEDNSNKDFKKVDKNNIDIKSSENNYPKNNNALKRKKTIKTYRDFAVEALKNKPTSLVKMIIEEKRKQEIEYNHSPKNKKNIFFILLSALLFVLGIVVVALVIIFLFQKSKEVETDKIPLEPKSLIYFDYKIENDISDADRSDIKKVSLEVIDETKIPIGDLKIFYFVKKDENGFKELVTSQDFLEILDTRAPLQFIRNLKEEFSFGVVSTIEGSSPFLILGINNFDASYNFLLTWERTLMSDLADLFNVNSKYNSLKFQDLDLYNKDTKTILDEEGKIVLGYSFIDLKTLVFFTNDKSFKKIINSFQNNKKRE